MLSALIHVRNRMLYKIRLHNESENLFGEERKRESNRIWELEWKRQRWQRKDFYLFEWLDLLCSTSLTIDFQGLGYVRTTTTTATITCMMVWCWYYALSWFPFIGHFVFYGDRKETDRFLHFMFNSSAPENGAFYYFVIWCVMESIFPVVLNLCILWRLWLLDEKLQVKFAQVCKQNVFDDFHASLNQTMYGMRSECVTSSYHTTSPHHWRWQWQQGYQCQSCSLH